METKENTVGHTEIYACGDQVSLKHNTFSNDRGSKNPLPLDMGSVKETTKEKEQAATALKLLLLKDLYRNKVIDKELYEGAVKDIKEEAV